MNILSLFDGLSGARLALDNIGVECTYFASEIDPYSESVSKYHYSDIIRLGDIQKIKGKDLPKIDIIIGGSPCFVAGVKVFTDKGYKNIEDIKVGDNVLTHKNRFKKVLNIGNTIGNTLILKAQGIKQTECTFDHPYYTMSMKRVYTNKKNIRVFSSPEWKRAINLKKGDFIGLPILNTNENKYKLNREDCWLIGRFIADGHIRKTKRKHRKDSYQYQIVYSIGSHKVDEFKENVKRNFSCYPHTKSTYRCVINSKEFLELLEELGFKNGAINKYLPIDILNLPKDLLEYVLDGYMSGDGSENNGVFKATSISEELIMGLNLAIAKVYNTNSSYEFTKRPKKTEIEKRIVNQNDTFTITFRKEMKKQSNATIMDNIVWLPVKNINRTKLINEVYNIEVEDDNSYTANNAIVHNCQGFSVAGHRKAFKDKRSNLFFEFVRLVEECKPEYFILENVKMKKAWLDKISGHLKTDYTLINSALVTAQNRQRCYWTNFPVTQPKDRGIVLKDIIEEGITDRDKSYCIDASYFKGGNLKMYFNKNKRQLIFGDWGTEREKSYCITATYGNAGDLNDYFEKHKRQLLFKPVALTEARTEKAKELRRKNRRDGKDFCPRREKELVPRKDDKANCLTGSLSNEHFIIDSINLERIQHGYIDEKTIKDVDKYPSLCAQSPDSKYKISYKPKRIGQIGKGGQGQRIYSQEGKSVTLNAHGGGQGAKTGLYAVAQRGRYKDGKVKQQYEIGSKSKSNAITSVQKDSMLLEEDGELLLVRKLTPIECERLQGIPDNWTKYGINEKEEIVTVSNTRRYQMIGNGFTIPVIEHILKEIL